jgi:nucleoside-diphosphate-sugar epimerase
MKIYVAGHRGLVGSAIVRAIESNGEHTWIGQTRSELDLLDRDAVFSFLASLLFTLASITPNQSSNQTNWYWLPLYILNMNNQI